MNLRVALVVCLLVAAAALALPAVAQDDGPDESDENVTVGDQVSAFMQSTEANAGGSVDDGMFEARLETANDSEHAALVEERTARLEERYADAQRQVERLRQNRSTLPSVAYRARMSSASVELASIRASANRTARVGEQAGVNTTRLQTLRTQASELSGQEVASIARELGGVVAPGPPDHAGPPGNGTPPGGGGPPDDGGGPPDDSGREDGGTGNEGTGTGDDGNPGAGTGGDGDQGTGTGDDGNQDSGTGDDETQDSGAGDDGNQGTGNGDRGTGDHGAGDRAIAVGT